VQNRKKDHFAYSLLLLPKDMALAAILAVDERYSVKMDGLPQLQQQETTWQQKRGQQLLGA
jgi:hypothetical protein